MNFNSKLSELENRIANNKKDFLSVGTALKEIRDQELYKIEFRSFKSYYTKHWGFSRSKVHRWIRASEIYNELATFGNNLAIPSKESQWRELLNFEDRKLQASILYEIQKSGIKLTAKNIKEIGTTFQLIGPPDKRRKPSHYIRVTKEEIELEFVHVLLDYKRPHIQQFWTAMETVLEKGGSMVMALYPND